MEAFVDAVQSPQDPEAARVKTFSCGTYNVTIVQQSDGKFLASYRETSLDHSYSSKLSQNSRNRVLKKRKREYKVNAKSLDIESVLQDVNNKQVTNAVFTDGSLMHSTDNITIVGAHAEVFMDFFGVAANVDEVDDKRYEVFSSDLENGKQQANQPYEVFELVCENCGSISHINIAKRSRHLKDYLDKGVAIHCQECHMKCNAMTSMVDGNSADSYKYNGVQLGCKEPECSTQFFKDFRALSAHTSIKHPPLDAKCRSTPGKDKPTLKHFKCKVVNCVRRFLSYHQYKQHLKCHEPNATLTCSCKGCLINLRKPGSKIRGGIECTNCAEVFKIIGAPTVLEKGIGFLCPSCGTTNRSAQVKRNIPIMSMKPLTFICSYPGCEHKMFKTITKHNAHYWKHIEEPVVCDKCGIMCRNRYTLVHHHTARCVGRGKPCVCDVCKRHFSSKYKLYNHFRHTHAKMRNLCHICGQTGLKDLRRHILIHCNSEQDFNAKRLELSNKTHPCPECGKFFAKKKMMSQHLRNFHCTKRFSCIICCRKFKTKLQMKRHEKLHYNPNTRLVKVP